MRKLPFRSLALALGPVLAFPAGAQSLLAEDFTPIGVDDVEITPDGRLAVVRDNTQNTTARVYDLQDPATPSVSQQGPMFGLSGPCLDAVAVTNERAVVIGSGTLILDLTQPGYPLLSQTNTGESSRDVAITPDGTLAVVRGGRLNGAGSYVFDLASGAPLAFHPGEAGDYFSSTYTFDVDAVVCDDEHAVTLSFLSGAPNPRTRVHLWDLHPAGGGAPVVIWETDPMSDMQGAPHDVSIAPNGTFAAVRSEYEVSAFRLNGGASSQIWSEPLNPGPLGGAAMDTVECSNSRVATISRWSVAGFGTQVDVFDLAGNRHTTIQGGDPHDLEITPSGDWLVARTHQRVLLFDLVNLPAPGASLVPADFQALIASNTSWGAGMDSLAVNDECVLAVARNGDDTRVGVYDIRQGSLETVFSYVFGDRSIDVALTPDGTKGLIAGAEGGLVLDLIQPGVLLEYQPVLSLPGGYPWCDAVAADNDQVVFTGTLDPGTGTGGGVLGGWYAHIDLFNQPTSFCSTNANSTGAAADLRATGSATVASNDLRLVASGLPTQEFGFFFYGDGTQNTAYGDGFVCVAGQVGRFPVGPTGALGSIELEVDYANLPAVGGVITAGSTWNFQFVYRDTAQPMGAGWNLTNALGVPFE